MRTPARRQAAAVAVTAAAVALTIGLGPGPATASAAPGPATASAARVQIAAEGRRVQAVTASVASGQVQRTTSAAAPSCDPSNPPGSLRPNGPPQVTPGSLMAQIRSRGFLIAGVDLTLYHLSFLSPLDGQIEGFNIDLLHAISTAIFGRPDKIQFVSLQDAARLPAVQSGAVDVVAQPTTVTCARLQQVDFSTVYIETRQRVLVQNDSPVRSISDLGGKKVCGVTGAGSFAELDRRQAAGLCHLAAAPRIRPVRQRGLHPAAGPGPVGRQLRPLARYPGSGAAATQIQGLNRWRWS